MKERMRDLNIKMTELSEYIKVSRPTLYKYIESYERGELNSIPKLVAELFDLINDPASTKERVVSFSITAFSQTDSGDIRDAICRYLNGPSSSQSKVELMYKLSASDCLDDIVPYISNCMDILSGDTMDDERLYQVARLVILRSHVTKGVPLKVEELREARGLLEGSYGR